VLIRLTGRKLILQALTKSVQMLGSCTCAVLFKRQALAKQCTADSLSRWQPVTLA
jgi:hypothetical protein